jgi:hypothetical protein
MRRSPLTATSDVIPSFVALPPKAFIRPPIIPPNCTCVFCVTFASASAGDTRSEDTTTTARILIWIVFSWTKLYCGWKW